MADGQRLKANGRAVGRFAAFVVCCRLYVVKSGYGQTVLELHSNPNMGRNT